MRKDVLVCYDIWDDTRLRKVHKIMRGYGQWVQYSIFLCGLTDRQRFKLMNELQGIIHNWKTR